MALHNTPLDQYDDTLFSSVLSSSTDVMAVFSGDGFSVVGSIPFVTFRKWLDDIAPHDMVLDGNDQRDHRSSRC